MKKGFVYLVGAGPGRTDLITVRGAEVLKKADCVIYDKLANPALLKYAPADAEIIHVPKNPENRSQKTEDGKIAGDSSQVQQKINRLLIEKAAEGKIIVRLKGGDPCMFGRAAEELAVLCRARIDFEIVPGVTAGVAVAAYAGIMLTDRNYSSQVVFVTGREAKGKSSHRGHLTAESNIDFSLLAKFPGTIVFYMGMGNLESIAQKLINNGMSKDTPAAVVTEITFPTQRCVKSTLERISETCRQNDIGPPAIIVIGAAASSEKIADSGQRTANSKQQTANSKKLKTNCDWFTKLPLFGKNIVITRDETGNVDFADKIIARGGNPIRFATFAIRPLTSRRMGKFLPMLIETKPHGQGTCPSYKTQNSTLSLGLLTENAVLGTPYGERYTLNADYYDWVIFTSANGVVIFFEALESLGKDARVFGRAKIAAIGARTAEMLARFGIRADFVPSVYTSEQLGKQILNYTSLNNKKVLLLRSKIASKELVELLESGGAAVNDVAVYTAVTQKNETGWLLEKIEKGEIDWLTFASPSSVNGFFEQIDGEIVKSSTVKIASIGPVTSRQLESLGFDVDVTADEHTLDGLLDAIEKVYKQTKEHKD